jgi:hypothetical protein
VTRRWLSIWCGALAAGCTARPPAPAPGGAAATGAPPALPVVALAREGCYGGCERSRLELRGDGTVVRTRGQSPGAGRPDGPGDTGAVAGADVRRLAAHLERAGFLALDSAYVPGAPGCGPYAPDAPTVTLSLRTARGRHAVRHDHGCATAPRLLLTLEGAVDSVGDPRRWLRSRTAGGR